MTKRFTVNDSELFEAKVVILDILGWGIPPQYLLDCGISELAVVVCLAQLKLRIPQELEPLIDEAERNTGTLSIAPPSDSSNSPPSTLSPNAPPFKPSYPEPITAPSNVPDSPVPSKPLQVSSVDMVDLEQQRKQELLARRAALQSMKKNNGNLSNGASHNRTPPTPSSSKPAARPSPPPSKSKDVDAFLADLIPGGEDSIMQDGDHDSSGEVERALEAEEEQPASRASSSAQRYSPSTPSFSPYPPGATPDTTNISSHVVMSPRENSSGTLDLGEHLSNQFIAPNSAPSSNNNSKRMGKRPVAADFVVDYSSNAEPSPSAVSFPSPSFTNGSPNLSTDQPHGNSRRRRHFGPQVQHRLVIDLSDEDESSDEEEEKAQPAPAKTTPTPSTSFAAGVIVGPSREGSATPSTVDEEKHRLLVKKRAEIEKMRELIRQMEEKKKRTTLSSSTEEEIAQRGTSEPLSTVTATNIQITTTPALSALREVIVKTEEPDDMIIDSPLEMTVKCTYLIQTETVSLTPLSSSRERAGLPTVDSCPQWSLFSGSNIHIVMVSILTYLLV